MRMFCETQSIVFLRHIAANLHTLRVLHEQLDAGSMAFRHAQANQAKEIQTSQQEKVERKFHIHNRIQMIWSSWRCWSVRVIKWLSAFWLLSVYGRDNSRHKIGFCFLSISIALARLIGIRIHPAFAFFRTLPLHNHDEHRRFLLLPGVDRRYCSTLQAAEGVGMWQSFRLVWFNTRALWSYRKIPSRSWW